VDDLADSLVLSGCLSKLHASLGGYKLVSHWPQGELHHDLVLRVRGGSALPGDYLVVSANCNGGVKEVLCLAEPPTRSALWHWRCPERGEFSGALPQILDQARTLHFIEPNELLDERDTAAQHSVRIARFGTVPR
jgi:hypothetical protein